MDVVRGVYRGGVYVKPYVIRRKPVRFVVGREHRYAFGAADFNKR